MTDLWVALSLAIAIEGIAYALFPEAMKQMMARVQEMPASTLRTVGLIAAVVGVTLVWLIRG